MRCPHCGLEDPQYYKDVLETLKQAESRISTLERLVRYLRSKLYGTPLKPVRFK